jgi:tyrosyl-tRNA synthetase
MTDEQIKINIRTYTEQVFKILNKEKTEIAYNSKWFNKFGINGLLDLAGKSTVAQMLVRDDFRKRYKENKSINIVEFLYPLLQAYDSVILNADVELGGNDQKFNLLLGREIQRDYGIQDVQVVITMPLLEGIDGVKKMSKSYNNYIALNDSPNEMFGKIMSISDSLMYKYYELLTHVNLAIIKNVHPKQAKSSLAFAIVKKYYDSGKALKAKQEFDKIFSKKYIPNEIREYKILEFGRRLSDLLVKSDMVSSKNEARRIIKQGGIRIDSQKIDKDFVVEYMKSFILQVGKKKFVKIIANNK